MIMVSNQITGRERHAEFYTAANRQLSIDVSSVTRAA